MHTKNDKLTLKSYLDFNQLLQQYQGTHEVNRTFALRYQELQENPLQLLAKWQEKNHFRLTETLDSTKYLHYLTFLTTTFGFLFLLFGFLTGFGLLSYSGAQPVNVIYFLLVVVMLPLLSMVVSILSMVSNGVVANFFNHFFPLYWLEKMVNFLSFKDEIVVSELPFSSVLTKWIFLKRLQLFSLLFSVGILFALLLMIVARDIAFGWSTTLQLSPQSLQSLLAGLGFWWHSMTPSAIPSLELVEISHYFRLGERLNSEMIHHADQLGAWWKFLAMSTLVYAIALRFVFLMLSRYGYQQQLEKEFLELNGIDKILHEFKTPYVSTKSEKIEEHLAIVEHTQEQVSEDVHKVYNNILGWNFLDEELQLVNDSKGINSSEVHTVGGSHTFAQDQTEAQKVNGTVLLYVKSWEPPTMDFVDFLHLLIENQKADEVQVYPLGTTSRYYESDSKDVAVWVRKIQGLKSKKVWVIDV